MPAIERLQDLTEVEKYNITLHNRWEGLGSEVDLESMWEYFKETINDVSLEVLGKQSRAVKGLNLSPKTKNLQLQVQRGQFEQRDPKSNANRSRIL